MGRPSHTRTRVRSRRGLSDEYAATRQTQPSSLSAAYHSLIPGPGTIRDYCIGALLMFVLLQATRGFVGADQVLCAVSIGLLLLSLLQLPLAQTKSEHSDTRPKTDVLRRTEYYKNQREAKGRKRTRKTLDNRSHLLVRLRAIFDVTRTSDHCRKALAEGLSELARSCQMLTTKDRLRVCSSIWPQLQLEALPRVRAALLRLALVLLKPLDQWENMRYIRGVQAVVLRILEEQHLQQAVHESSFMLLDFLLRAYSGVVENDRILFACVAAIQRHYERGETSTTSLKSAISFCMREAVNNYHGPIGRLIDSEHTLHFLLEQVGPAKESCRDLYCTLTNSFHLLLLYATQPERVSIVVRYYPMMERAIALMDAESVAYIIEHQEVAGIALNCQPLLEQVARLLPLDAERSVDYDEVCRLAVYLLEHALGDSDKLTELLCMGYLTSAHWFAHDSDDSHGGYIAPMLARVLLALPCWAARFRKLTENGPASNTVAILGRRQRNRSSRSGYYMML